MPTLSPLAAPEVVFVMTTTAAISNEKIDIMTTSGFHWSILNITWSSEWVSD